IPAENNFHLPVLQPSAQSAAQNKTPVAEMELSDCHLKFVNQ
ncbi:hypothetical protein LINGRAHAP2_LOCUS14241, partial [Linum grandiflorum]